MGLTPAEAPGGALILPAGQALLTDPARLAAARRMILEGPPSAGLERLTKLAATLLETPYAEVCLLLELQVTLCSHAPERSAGKPVDALTPELCARVMTLAAPLVVEDARGNEWTGHTPAVTAGRVGALLAVPLLDRDGHQLGALCVADERPRTWTVAGVGILGELAYAMVDELDRGRLAIESATNAARLEVAMSSADIGGWEWDLRTGELSWDDRVIRLWGYEPETFVPEYASFRARLHPDDVALVNAAHQRAIDTLGTYAAEYRIVLPDGTVRWVQAGARVLPDSAGRPARMLGAVYETTGQRRTLEEREEALRRAEQSNARLRLVAEASTRLSASLEPAEVLERLAALIVPELGEWVSVVLRESEAAPLLSLPAGADPDRLVLVHVTHTDPEQGRLLRSAVDALPLSVQDETGAGAVIRTGVAEWLPDVRAEAVADYARRTIDRPLLRRLAALRTTERGSALTVPLTSRGRTLGAMTVSEARDSPLDRALIAELAGRAATALDNALLFRAERRIGLDLQRSLLPHASADVDGIELASRYRPATEGALAGGDFYQAVRVGDDLLLALGDVMGHGMRSAARMGQLRAAVATLGLEGHQPGELLNRLGRDLPELLDLPFATLLVCRYCPASRRLAMASAGHPPPLLVPVDGEPDYHPVDPGPPLGVDPAVYAEAVVDLAPGTTLVLYSDGLVENRGESLTVGLERLRVAASGVRLPPEGMADHLLSALGRETGGDDDIALLVLAHQ